MSDSVRSRRWQPTRLPRPWDSPGKNTGVGCHFLLQCMKEKVEVKFLSRVWLLATPWSAAYQAPPSMGFSRQEYWSELPFPFSNAWKWKVKVKYCVPYINRVTAQSGHSWVYLHEGKRTWWWFVLGWGGSVKQCRDRPVDSSWNIPWTKGGSGKQFSILV